MNKYKTGSAIHEPWVRFPGEESVLSRSVEAPVVMLANDEDGYYTQEFNTWEDINGFIGKLRKCATEAFGEDPKP